MGFKDNGDGTITDETTGLMWEKKTQGTGDAHDVTMKYSWSQLSPQASALEPRNSTAPDGTAFTVFLAALNRCTIMPFGQTSCFAGYHDWRLPTAAELLAIIVNRGIAPIFGPTQLALYWSSDTHVINTSGGELKTPGDWANAVYFDAFDAPLQSASKETQLYVRAVRSAAAVCEHLWSMGAVSGPR